jgi:hypothetical protein
MTAPNIQFVREPVMNSPQFFELLLQSLEHERGGVKVYTAALKCAQRPGSAREWEKYLAQTEQHVEALTQICEVFDIDPFTMTPGTQIVKAVGTSLVEAMNYRAIGLAIRGCADRGGRMRGARGNQGPSRLGVAGEASKSLSGDERQAVQDAYEKIEDEEDEHLYHTQGWCRELLDGVARTSGRTTASGREAGCRPRPPRRSTAKEMRQPRH